MVDVIFTDKKEEYLKRLAEKEAINKRKSNRYTTMFMVIFILGVLFIVLILNRSHAGAYMTAGMSCLLLSVVFSKLDDEPNALYKDARERQKDFRDFFEKHEKNQILHTYYGGLSDDKYILYEYEDNGEAKTDTLHIDEYEYRTDIDDSILIFGDKIIYKQKFYMAE